MVRKGFIVFLNEKIKRQSCLLHSRSNITEQYVQWDKCRLREEDIGS